jgi:hypothetical protein
MNGIPIDVPLPEGLEFRVRPACCYPSDAAGLPEVGYAAYNCGGPTETAGLNYQGLPCPTWPELPGVVVEKWEAAAAAIKHVVTADLLRGLAGVLGIEERTPAAVMDAAEELRERVRRLSADPMTFLRTCYSGETDAAAAAALERAINALAGPSEPRDAVRDAIARETDPKRLVCLRAALLVLQDEQPTPASGVEDVWADLIAEERNRADRSEALIAAATARHTLGIERYGRTLSYAGNDGRDRKRDTDEEALDLMAYAYSERDIRTYLDARCAWLRRNA